MRAVLVALALASASAVTHVIQTTSGSYSWTPGPGYDDLVVQVGDVLCFK